MSVHIVMHESFEAPAAIELWAVHRGHRIAHTRLHAGDALPERVDADLLVVMGGPQCPDTTTAECAHFDAEREIAVIARAIADGRRVLGVCLGAQLIGEALGARYDHSPNREIGVFPITLTDDGRRDPLFGGFPGTFPVGHWHGDMPGLTGEARVLATSEGCPRQVVRYSPTVYGLQCHFEFTRESMNGMVENSTAELERYAGLPYVKTPAALRAEEFAEMNALLWRFLDGFAGPAQSAGQAGAS